MDDGQGGYQSKKKLFDIPQELPVVAVQRISGSLEEVKKKVKDYLSPFREKGRNSYFNKSAGFEIQLSSNGIKHTLIRAASPDLANSLIATPELLKEATYLGKDKNRKKTRGVKFYHNFAGKVSIDGDVKTVLITAREVSDGKIFYDQAIIKSGSDNSTSGGNLLETDAHVSARGAEPSNQNIQQNQTKNNPEGKENAEIKADLKKRIGKGADKVVIDRDGKASGKQSAIEKGAEGWYTKGDKVYINPDKISGIRDKNGKVVLSKEEHIAFVAWHELGHRGIEVTGAWKKYETELRRASNNPMVSELAQKIKAAYTERGVELSDVMATEEALVELNAAMQTKNMDALGAKWGLTPKTTSQSKLAKIYQRLVGVLQDVLKRITGKPRALNNQQVFDLLETISKGAVAPVEGVEKGHRSVNSIGLQSPTRLGSHDNLSRGDAKTENDLSQVEKQDNDDARYSLPPTNDELAAEIQSTEKRVGGKKAYEKAKAQGKTKLGYRQWIQVRMPAFKRWFGDWENLANRAFLDSDAVAHMRGNEVPNMEKASDIVAWAKDFFYQHNKGVYSNTELGDISVTRRSVKDSISHGLGKEKAQALWLLPEALPKMKVLSYLGDKNGNQGFVLGAPVEMGGQRYVLTALVRKSNNSQRLYVHEIDLEKNLQALSTDASASKGELNSEQLGVMNSVLHDIYRVNTDEVSKIVDPETGEPKIMYQNDTTDFTDQPQGNAVFINADHYAKTMEITDPNQIKSAVSNNGGFTPDNDDIRFSLGIMPTAEDSMLAQLKGKTLKNFADKFLPVKNLQKSIELNGGKLNLDNNVYSTFPPKINK